MPDMTPEELAAIRGRSAIVGSPPDRGELEMCDWYARDVGLLLREVDRLTAERDALRAIMNTCHSALCGFMGSGKLDMDRAQEVYAMLTAAGCGPQPGEHNHAN